MKIKSTYCGIAIHLSHSNDETRWQFACIAKIPKRYFIKNLEILSSKTKIILRPKQVLVEIFFSVLLLRMKHEQPIDQRSKFVNLKSSSTVEESSELANVYIAFGDSV